MSNRKQFDIDLFKSNDDSARRAVTSYVQRGGLMVKPNDDIYGPDLVIYKGFKPGYYIEVEVKKVWKDYQDLFPWKTIQLPERKSKFLKLGKPIEFFILRNDLKMAIVIPDFVVENSPKKEVPNRFVPEGEFFYQIDVSQCDIISLEE